MAGFSAFVGILAGGYLALTGGLYAGQRRLLYRGGGPAPDPAKAGLDGLRVIETKTSDGLVLRHWYIPGPPGAPVVAVFHGNAGDIGGRAGKYAPLAAAGFGLLLAEYRGFGGNPGKPSEQGLLADARAVLDWLNAQDVPDARIAVYGESLGTGVAVAMAGERQVRATVLEAPFTSIADIAQAQYWYVPAKWLVRDRFDSLMRIERIQAPLLILHGGQDRTIPPRFGERLYAAAPDPKRWAFFEEADHLDLWDRGAGATVIGFLEEHLAKQPGRVAEPA
ncbi:alpha/beta hydrolase [Ferruginivarius sediminum]|uniref:Alpha/beta hydrolase n=1 Tax=Ferruginivarius sediminum TaxID=2661937 RepID=A0A369TIA3_9PROT|nr:alpha/beta hydrolase [Ferruginivarius sediminum]RDD63857.1 alpha/beta hydrolase [Ferruginivarius sediminum]